jgi:hypothetical protein
VTNEYKINAHVHTTEVADLAEMKSWQSERTNLYEP